MLKKIKSTASAAKTSAGLETAYISAKSNNNFPHVESVAQHIIVIIIIILYNLFCKIDIESH